ncbi:hypothetical protein DFH09DRAFT_1088033 [Mycena vulgaris]|nr:hypothetical protein DFH09DRAFT_1088033 [Mycena vulgaris]
MQTKAEDISLEGVFSPHARDSQRGNGRVIFAVSLRMGNHSGEGHVLTRQGSARRHEEEKNILFARAASAGPRATLVPCRAAAGARDGSPANARRRGSSAAQDIGAQGQHQLVGNWTEEYTHQCSLDPGPRRRRGGTTIAGKWHVGNIARTRRVNVARTGRAPERAVAGNMPL